MIKIVEEDDSDNEEITEPTYVQINKDDYNEDFDKPRNLKLHSGRLSSMKEEVIKKAFKDGANEFEVQIYGDSPFHLKFGYSNSQITYSHLVRLQPFTNSFIEYNGKLDHPDRMVSNYQEMWKKVVMITQSNGELIPEWFYLPEMLVNNDYWWFGFKNNKQLVSEVILPPWAQNDPSKFVMFQRKFIENSIYSKDISTWIEMVFGRKQQSEKQLNVYFEVCDYQYFNKIDKTQEFSRMKLKAIAEFQQIPIKLFEKKHPKAFTKNFE